MTKTRGMLMLTEADFLRAIADDSANAPSTWLILADWLEERGDPRCELVRLQHLPPEEVSLSPHQRDARIRALLAAGIGPLVPRLVNSIGMEFALLPAGTFLMGSPESETDRLASEGPQHEVEITQSFYLGVYPVTQTEYQQVLGKNPSYFSASGGGEKQVKRMDTGRFPVETVSWEEAVEFCRRVSANPEENAAGRLYRLPSEAEWEYACRGGAFSYSVFHLGDGLSSTQANFNGNYPYGDATSGKNLQRPTPVGSYAKVAPHPWGLCDLHGNVWEWCADWWDENYYTSSPRTDPAGLATGTYRVLRGGSWYDFGRYCRSAFRYDIDPGGRNDDLGFRVVCVVSSARAA